MYNLPNSKMASNFRCYTIISIFYLFITFVSLSTFTSACHPITRDCPLKDGDVIVSENAKYALGFFSPKGSNIRYVGIWFNKIEPQSVVWVANRRNPISGNGGMLRIGALGNLIISNQTSDFIWSTLPKNVTNNLSAFLRDDGNLVLQVGSVGSENNRALWKSSNQPTDTYLAGTRIYVDPSQSDIRRLTAWRSPNDPSPGKYSLSIDPCGSPQFVIWEGAIRKWRSGYWNGIIFDGVQGMKGMYYNGFRFDNDDGKLYFTYIPQNSTDLIKSWIRWDGTEVQEKWDKELTKWDLMESYPIHGECDHYNQCGPFGICDFKSSPICSCIQGFVPKDLDQWKSGNFSGGCIRRTNLDCLYGVTRDGFFKAERVKLPDLVDYVGSENANECEKRCLKNCSCTAYAFVTGINCMIWSGQLIDLEQFQIGEINLFIRLHRSELELIGGSTAKKIAIVAAIIAGVACLITSVWLFRVKMKGLRKRNNEMLNDDSMCVLRGELPRPCDLRVEGQQGSVTDQLLMYDFSCVAAATNNFSDDSKLGYGGFGHVYKGTLPGTNQVIAVKRLSEKSRQGVEEFKNEIALMSNLQHRNLVRLLGYCIQGDERMILYEYMPNKSLASVLFDLTKKAQLDWRKRFDIIEGIARGILYLHRDSRVRIIHRDLKASNILLDEEMNPKISDFGMARIFGGNQNEVNTGRLVGTPGYMAPEYAMGGHFSVKSDVYSFGVLLLEIISGQKNMSFQSNDYSNVIGYAWELWNGGQAIELADPSIANLFNEEEMLRCIHIAMLCVQDAANDRPNMESVLLMLESTGELPKPMQPSLASIRHHGNSTEMWNECPPSNDLTMSTINGR